jgi:AbrB family looped-hinge helix DNA binding protein
MKVTVKGQITIPLALRERFGIGPGTEVEFVPEKDGLRLRVRKNDEKKRDKFGQWLAHAEGSATRDLTTDEIMAMTRGND